MQLPFLDCGPYCGRKCLVLDDAHLDERLLHKLTLLENQQIPGARELLLQEQLCNMHLDYGGLA